MENNVASLKAQTEAELNNIKAQIRQVEEQMIQLQKAKDQLLTRGIELQGMVKAYAALEQTSSPAPVVVEEAK